MLASARPADWIYDLDAGEIALVVSDDNAVIRASNRRYDHVEATARTPGGFAVRHQARPDQTGLVVERQNTPREQRLRSFRPREFLLLFYDDFKMNASVCLCFC